MLWLLYLPIVALHVRVFWASRHESIISVLFLLILDTSIYLLLPLAWAWIHMLAHLLILLSQPSDNFIHFFQLLLQLYVFFLQERKLWQKKMMRMRKMETKNFISTPCVQILITVNRDSRNEKLKALGSLFKNLPYLHQTVADWVDYPGLQVLWRVLGFHS